MTNALKKTMGQAQSARYGLDMLQSHCNTLNNYKWVQASGKRYVIAKDENGRHYLDFRMVKDA
jgi:hypothetical protein